MKGKLFLVLLCLAVVYGCSGTFRDALTKGDAPPAGTVLLIGKITIDPLLEQGNIGVQAARGTHKGVVKMNFADNADQPLDKDAMIPFSASEQMDWSYTLYHAVRGRKDRGTGEGKSGVYRHNRVPA